MYISNDFFTGSSAGPADQVGHAGLKRPAPGVHSVVGAALARPSGRPSQPVKKSRKGRPWSALGGASSAPTSDFFTGSEGLHHDCVGRRGRTRSDGILHKFPRPAPRTVDSWLPPRSSTGVVNVDPFFAKIIASRRAGCVWLAFFETSCVAPGCS